MAAITVVVGPPCAGKSTYIEEQRAPGDVVVDFDKLALALGSDQPHAAPDAVREVAFSARKSAIGRVLKGVDAAAWIIHTSPWPGQLGRYAEAGAEIVLLDPGLEECLARAQSDDRPEGTEDAIRQWYDNPPLTDLEKRRTAGMRTKDFSARVKAVGAGDGLAEGQFVALVSVFDTEDSMGDVVRPGAFTETLAAWSAKGDDIPVIWSHAWGDPFAHVGRVVKAVETLQGLEVTGQIEDLEENPTAAQVYRLLKGRRVTQFSFAYDEVESAWVRDDEHPWGGYYELRRLKLHEVGPCLVGANQETELIAAKARGLAAGAKAGRVLSQKNFEALTSAYESIGEVLASAEQEKNRDAKKTEGPGQPGAAAADGATPSAKPADALPAKGWTSDAEFTARVAELVQAALAKGTADTDTTGSSTKETTPGPREASEDAAKAGADSARLRTRLQLAELEASLTE